MRVALVLLAVGLAFLSSAQGAGAMSVTEFAAHTPDEQGAILVRFVNRIVDEVGKADSAKAQAIHEYFYTKPTGGAAPEGLRRLEAELRNVVLLGKQGKADLDRVQVETLLLDVINVNILNHRPTASPTP